MYTKCLSLTQNFKKINKVVVVLLRKTLGCPLIKIKNSQLLLKVWRILKCIKNKLFKSPIKSENSIRNNS